MPLKRLTFTPGVQHDGSRYSSTGSWSDSDKVRFRSGSPEKIGGWQKAVEFQFQGVCRNLFAFSDLAGNYYLGVGTHLKYYIERGGSMYDITPIRTTITQSNPFTTTNGSTTVLVSIPNNGATTNDFVTFSGSSSVGGLNLNGEYRITNVLTSSNFTITAEFAATSSATGGGSTAAEFQINTGLDTTVYANGWGAGTWGGVIPSFSVSFTGSISGTTLTVATVPAGVPSATVNIGAGDLVTGTNVSAGPPGSSATYITEQISGTTGGVGTYSININYPSPLSLRPMNAITGTGWGSASASLVSSSRLRLWSSDNFGQNLIINPRDSAIYYWSNAAGLGTRAVLLSSLPGANSVPSIARQILVSELDRKVIAFGCTDIVTGTQDRLLIRWSDTENPAVWNPTEINSAGGLRIPSGSEFISAVETKNEILVWSDDSVHALKYIGAPFEYSISRLAMTSIVAPNATVSANDLVFWMGQNGFFQYDGRVFGIPCSVKDYVFNDINWNQAEKITSGSNMSFNEVWWFYPTANSEENNRYVIYNYNEKVWSVGSIVRTAWIDRSIEDYPRAAGVDGYVYYHEIGQDDGSTNPNSPIESYIESAPTEIGEGESFGFAWRMIPDVTFRNSSAVNPKVDFVLLAQDYSGSNFSQAKSNETTLSVRVPVEQFTEQTYFRLRGRMLTLRLESTDVGVAWRLGIPRVDIRTDGRR